MMKQYLRPALVAVALAAAVPAAAYVLPTDALLDLLQERRDKLKADTLSVEGTLVLFDELGGRRTLPATHTIAFDGRCRLEVGAADETLAGAYVAADRGRITPPSADLLKELVILETLACPLISTRQNVVRDLRGFFRDLGVNVRYTGLGRIEGMPAYVVGAKPWEDEAQVWLDKEIYVPVRVKGQVGGVFGDVHLTGYADPATGEWHPRVMELYVDGRLAARFTAERIEQNVDVEAGAFR